MARIVFFGTPEISVPTLRALHEAGHDIALVVSQADKRRGRRGELAPSPVKEAALELGLPVTDKVKDVLAVEADYGVLVAFGRMIKPDVLAHFPIINLHPSLLPRWRGATPAEAAILAGDTKTGICLMQLVEEMDAGPIYETYETVIEPGERAATLYERLFAVGNELLVNMLNGSLPLPIPQSGEPTYCGKLSPEDFHIDWNKPAEHIQRLTRIGRPWTTFRGKRVLILDAEMKVVDGQPAQMRGSMIGPDVVTVDGLLTLKRVQPEGKGPMDAASWINGARPQENEPFE